ncbi:MAG: PAS domain-containing protein [Chloroflexota bacterium]|nr:PAS domain-containing protein [Chloroflexota bacterium]
MLEKFTTQTLEAILDTLPVDLTFIDANDIIRYYNKEGNRIHKRTPSLLGSKVHDCHKPQSHQHLNEVLDDLKSGKKPFVEFWSDHDGRKIHTHYFAVKDKSGRYIGALGVDQDITEIQKITGQKRY